MTAATLAGCRSAGQEQKNDLDAMQTTQLQIGEHNFEVWLALTSQEREYGLMQVTSRQMAALPADPAKSLPARHRGMLFVFPSQQPLSFWMYNTLISLDIAYIRSDGEIVGVYTMAAGETRTYPSGEPAQCALEVEAGLFESLGIGVGDRVEIPDSLLKAAS